MKKITLVIMVQILLLIGCSSEQNTELEESINSVIEDKNNHEININTLTTFNWEEAHLFAPYTQQESMEESLGVKYKDKSGMSYRDDIFLLVFINDDKVIQYAEIEHQDSNLSIGEKKYLTPSEDLIIIERY